MRGGETVYDADDTKALIRNDFALNAALLKTASAFNSYEKPENAVSGNDRIASAQYIGGGSAGSETAPSITIAPTFVVNGGGEDLENRLKEFSEQLIDTGQQHLLIARKN